MSMPQLVYKSKNHQLNNEGCRCQLCQRVCLQQNNIIVIEPFHDQHSEQYRFHEHNEAYLKLIDQFVQWESKGHRKLRFSMPEMCVFNRGFPEFWVTKNKDNAPTKIIRSKSKMNMFEIQHFFLQGFLFHHPEIINKKRQKQTFKEKGRQQCIVAAKYNKNITQMLTLDQIENLFKSKFKYMRDGLLYLQTLVGGHLSKEQILRINLDEMQKSHSELYERAKNQAKIFVGQIKVTDLEFWHQKDEINFEKKLKRENMRLYLIYVSLKIVFIDGKMKNVISKRTIFKWTYIFGSQFLWDIRVVETVPSSPYWQNSVTQALQIKLKKTMSLLELQPESTQIDPARMSLKARQMSDWLEKNAQNQWNQMKIIRNRLQKLQNQKKSLIQSQKQGHHGGTFRMRHLKRRETMNQSFNPQN